MGRLTEQKVEPPVDYPLLTREVKPDEEFVISPSQNWYDVSLKGLWNHWIDFILLRIVKCKSSPLKKP